MSSAKRGFTLVELLIIISIIAILSTVAVVTYSNVSVSGRDAKRKSDLQAIAKALEVYYQKNQQYPGVAGTWYQSTNTATDWWIPNLSTNEINKLLNDPKGNGGSPWLGGGSWGYAYCSPNASGCGGLYGGCSAGSSQFFILLAKLESTNDPDRLATQGGNWCDGVSLISKGISSQTYVVMSP